MDVYTMVGESRLPASGRSPAQTKPLLLSGGAVTGATNTHTALLNGTLPTAVLSQLLPLANSRHDDGILSHALGGYGRTG